MREGVVIVVADDEQSPRDVVGTFRDVGMPREEPYLFVEAPFDGAIDPACVHPPRSGTK